MAIVADKRNNFDFLRFAAATLVIFSHAFPVARGPSEPDPLAVLTGGQDTFGAVAVKIFFIISGFLITQSFDRSRDWKAFTRARILRIYPGAALVIILATFVLGPLVTTLTLGEYFSHPETYRYLISATLVKGYEGLPGVFASNAFPEAVNGSLWTLRFELGCYLMVGVLGVLGALRVNVVGGLLLAVQVLVVAKPLEAPLFIFATEFASFFLAGSLFYLARDRILLKWWASLLALLAIIAGYALQVAPLVYSVAATYLVLHIAFSQRLPWNDFARRGDLSYGVYIFAFPVQQLIVWTFGGAMDPYLNFALATPLVLALATLSWRFVEKPFLGLKRSGAPGR